MFTPIINIITKMIIEPDKSFLYFKTSPPKQVMYLYDH